MPSLSVTLGLLCTLPLFNTVLAAPAFPRDDVAAPRSAIAVKLSKSTSRTRSLAQAEVVEDLIRKAQSGSGLTKRDAQFNVSPLITSLSPEKVADMVQRAAAIDPTYEPVDFGSWFQVQFPESMVDERDPEIAQILNNLAGYQEVASCQRLAGAKLPAVQPNDDPLFSTQGYLAAAGAGINAQYAWGFPGGDGAGTTIIDVERGWQLTHEDLVAAGITLLAGMNVKDRYGGNYPHGTAVLGEILMRDNTIGGVGIAPAAQGHVVGIQRTVNGAPVENQAEAILDAATFLNPGDVMLLEMQVADVNQDLWPVEILDAEYDAIRTVTALGITVIEPAANGGMDMDQPILRDGDTTARALLNKNSPDFRDSGAIMVGAGSSAVPRTRMYFSNFGSRVDVHSWGENIATSTVNEAYEDIYINNFSGTSGAAPIIAGAALSIQGMVNANRGSKLSPADLRDLITLGGTASSSPSKDKIGVQPDLRALIDGGHLQ
ncbi:peptidase S8/S53 domain-containing protein [Chaetomidium leptoderma]|uniref:Peptidase S8/S53 domain-containing protein n=1 Tax=Chaetomidium leptoderma TaxID=669021 RepID=A0AAN6VGH7_9PEZI|nr:peptidase S8/S53 domain-containing protein [Chaetomidium leptoderma]